MIAWGSRGRGNCSARAGSFSIITVSVMSNAVEEISRFSRILAGFLLLSADE